MNSTRIRKGFDFLVEVDSFQALLVYDVTARKSFESLDNWLKESLDFGAQNVIVYVCANKADLSDRQVSESEGSAWASARNMKYYEVSAKSGRSVVEMFNSLFKAVIESFPKLQ